MATDQAIGALAGQAMAKLEAEMGRLSALAGIAAPELPRDKDLRLQSAKRLDAIAGFMAQANDALEGQRAAAEQAAKAPATGEPKPAAKGKAK